MMKDIIENVKKIFDIDLINNENIAKIKIVSIFVGIVFIIGFINNFFIIWLSLSIISMIAMQESMKLFSINNDSIYLYAVLVWLAALFYPQPEDLIFIVVLIFASLVAYNQDFNKRMILPLLYPTVSFLFLLSLYIYFGINAMLWLFVVVSITDIGAYYTGKKVGKTQFCETSSSKTLEGVVGGLLAGTLFGMFFAIDNVSLYSAFIVSALVSLASVFGDLFENYLKREANVKTSGNLLTGYGGILDMVNGYLFGGIVMLILLKLLT